MRRMDIFWTPLRAPKGEDQSKKEGGIRSVF